MTKRKVLGVRRYKAGYEIREELADGSEFGCKDFVMKTAYTSSGDYIGDPKFAYRLCKKWGIKPEKIDRTYAICTIGFCEEEQKFYGWSHRAMFGFGIGSKTKKGDCGFVPGNVFEIYASLSKDERENIVKVDINGITIEHTTYGAVSANPDDPECNELKPSDPKIGHYTIETGRGEWIAETLDDARQMAIDFSRGVS